MNIVSHQWSSRSPLSASLFSPIYHCTCSMEYLVLHSSHSLAEQFAFCLNYCTISLRFFDFLSVSSVGIQVSHSVLRFFSQIHQWFSPMEYLVAHSSYPLTAQFAFCINYFTITLRFFGFLSVPHVELQVSLSLLRLFSQIYHCIHTMEYLALHLSHPLAEQFAVSLIYCIISVRFFAFLAVSHMVELSESLSLIRFLAQLPVLLSSGTLSSPCT